MAFDVSTGAGVSPTGVFDGSLGQFNPALGTLTSVGVDINGEITFELLASIAAPASVSTPEHGSIYLLGGALGLLWLAGYRNAFQTRTAAPARNPRSA